MLMAAEAHCSLFHLGVLHRDISAGNIMIRQKAEYIPGDSSSVVRPWQSEKILEGVMPQTEGFLSDFELASIRVVADGPQPHKQPNRPVTGTAIFASSELLAAIADGQTISRTYKQDVESFGWVFIYTMYRISLNDKDYRWQEPAHYAAIHDEFTSMFSAANNEEILTARKNTMPEETSYREGVFPGIDNLSDYLIIRHKSSNPNKPHPAVGAAVTIWMMLFELRPRSRRRPTRVKGFLRVACLESKKPKEPGNVADVFVDPYGDRLGPALARLARNDPGEGGSDP
ncbi:hypothetical protein BD413DRAFT_271048 [Trametes elegans]|nr:hypothetical protein BD413DRAFT_271048 [Trametes elegans]